MYSVQGNVTSLPEAWVVAGGSDLAGDVLLIQLQLHALLCKLPLQMCHLQVRGMPPPAAVSDAPVASPRLASPLCCGLARAREHARAKWDRSGCVWAAVG